MTWSWGPTGRRVFRVRVPYEAREVLVQYGPVALGDAPKKKVRRCRVSLKQGAYVFFSWPSKTTTIKSDSTCFGSFAWVWNVVEQRGSFWFRNLDPDTEVIFAIFLHRPYDYFCQQNRVFFCHTPRLFEETLLTLNLAPWTTVPGGGAALQGATRRATVSETGKDVLPVRFETGEEVNRKKTWNFGEIWSVGILGKADLLTWISRRFFWQFYGWWNVCTLKKQTCNIFFLRSRVCINVYFLILHITYIRISLNLAWPLFSTPKKGHLCQSLAAGRRRLLLRCEKISRLILWDLFVLGHGGMFS